MKIIAVLLTGLLLSGWLAAQYGSQTAPMPQDSEMAPWRRTASGWENARGWKKVETGEEKRLHPGVIASFYLLASLLALVAFSDQATAKAAGSAQSSSPTGALGSPLPKT